MGFEVTARSVPSGENRVSPTPGKLRIKAPSETCHTANVPSEAAERSASSPEKLMPMNGPKINGPDNSRRRVQFETFHNLITSLFPSKKAPEANKVPSCEKARPVMSCVWPTKVCRSTPSDVR